MQNQPNRGTGPGPISTSEWFNVQYQKEEEEEEEVIPAGNQSTRGTHPAAGKAGSKCSACH